MIQFSPPARRAARAPVPRLEINDHDLATLADLLGIAEEGVDDHHVLAASADEGVVTSSAIQDIVTGSADQPIIPTPSAQMVVPFETVDAVSTQAIVAQAVAVREAPRSGSVPMNDPET